LDPYPLSVIPIQPTRAPPCAACTSASAQGGAVDRAYSVFEIKAVDDDARIIEGVATTLKTDRIGDIVEPEGAQFKLPLPLLWQHDRHSPIGHVLEADVTEKRIRVRAQIASDEEDRKSTRLNSSHVK